ncbi:N-acetylmuramic acid 6-phosphate etherase [Pullulanibacillus sp. KACC 23026]|uniref:N-acetylmuramic acid 6-phosphate etherase n=1 Tax=Pullulanibacillus sp. KACC 23026 TaxID=3028315 RepID=UPI0023AFD76B|nr:N-acetylmuramic acid 6-phosphate etherase [Pullulanibacillus sp. KACC 23026]WEG14741.1 N-acetylmuramic acid 6-phosphate etherase [Pullulanibacillus sp. KACC 23026]
MGAHSLITESVNTRTVDIDCMPTLEMVSAINKEDHLVAKAVERVLPNIADAVDTVFEGLKNQGRVFFVGAGTSGRLGVLEAAECPPTFGVTADLFQAVIAGGERAVFKSVESAEDDEGQGKRDLQTKSITKHDVVIGIAASGRTPYVVGALRYAKQQQAKTIAIACNDDSVIGKLADVKVEVVTGPEVISGSTRMKAGTAQKLVLNMITTSSMIKMGKVYQNLMVDLNISNKKLRERAVNMLKMLTNEADLVVNEALEAASLNVKAAIVMLKKHIDAVEASALLEEKEGFVRKTLSSVKEEGTETEMEEESL